MPCSSLWVPFVPAARTTSDATNVLPVLAQPPPARSVVTDSGRCPLAGCRSPCELAYLGASSFGKVEVVLQQGVLGAMTAAVMHSPHWVQPLRVGPAPRRTGRGLQLGFTEEHADRRGNECVGDAHFFGDGADR